MAPSPTTFARVGPGSPFGDSPRFGANRRGRRSAAPGAGAVPTFYRMDTAAPKKVDTNCMTCSVQLTKAKTRIMLCSGVRLHLEIFEACDASAQYIRRSQTVVHDRHGEAARVILGLAWNRTRLGFGMLAAAFLAGTASAQQPALSFAPPADNGWRQVRGWALSNHSSKRVPACCH